MSYFKNNSKHPSENDKVIHNYYFEQKPLSMSEQVQKPQALRRKLKKSHSIKTNLSNANSPLYPFNKPLAPKNSFRKSGNKKRRSYIIDIDDDDDNGNNDDALIGPIVNILTQKGAVNTMEHIRKVEKTVLDNRLNEIKDEGHKIRKTYEEEIKRKKEEIKRYREVTAEKLRKATKEMEQIKEAEAALEMKTAPDFDKKLKEEKKKEKALEKELRKVKKEKEEEEEEVAELEEKLEEKEDDANKETDDENENDDDDEQPAPPQTEEEEEEGEEKSPDAEEGGDNEDEDDEGGDDEGGDDNDEEEEAPGDDDSPEDSQVKKKMQNFSIKTPSTRRVNFLIPPSLFVASGVCKDKEENEQKPYFNKSEVSIGKDVIEKCNDGDGEPERLIGMVNQKREEFGNLGYHDFWRMLDWPSFDGDYKVLYEELDMNKEIAVDKIINTIENILNNHKQNEHKKFNDDDKEKNYEYMMNKYIINVIGYLHEQIPDTDVLKKASESLLKHYLEKNKKNAPSNKKNAPSNKKNAPPKLIQKEDARNPSIITKTDVEDYKKLTLNDAKFLTKLGCVILLVTKKNEIKKAFKTATEATLKNDNKQQFEQNMKVLAMSVHDYVKLKEGPLKEAWEKIKLPPPEPEPEPEPEPKPEKEQEENKEENKEEKPKPEKKVNRTPIRRLSTMGWMINAVKGYLTDD